MKSFGKSVKGLRINNEDKILIDDKKKLYVVADGLGGEVAGEKASEIVIETFKEYKNENPKEELLRLVKLAHERIRKMIENEPSLEGMSSTVVAVKFENNKGYVVNVGDSPAFLLREKKLKMLTPLDRGHFSFLLTQAVGFNIEKIHENEFEIKENDKVLLCSDGLIDNLEKEKIRKILLNEKLELAVSKLINNALKSRRSPDNISVILIKV